MSAAIDADVPALLRQLLDEMRGLRADLGLQRKQDVDPALAEALAAIAGYIGDEPFTTNELVRYAKSDGGLLTVLKAAGVDTPRRLGKALQQIEGREIGGLRVEKMSRENRGTIWRIGEV